jgi:hypothetical protein
MSTACIAEHGFPGGILVMVVARLPVALRVFDDGPEAALRSWQPRRFGSRAAYSKEVVTARGYCYMAV